MEKGPYINNKMMAKEILHPLLDVEGNIVTKDEDSEVFNPFFASLNIRTVILRATRLCVDRRGEWGAEQTPCNPGGSS